MKYETSYGVIPLQKRLGKWNVLIIKHDAGHWGFPKGHKEADETPLETAARELAEETGLQINYLLTESPLEEKYIFRFKGVLINKTVHYYLAEVEGEVVLQTDEIIDSKWVPLSEAEKHLSFPQGRSLIQSTLAYLHKKEMN